MQKYAQGLTSYREGAQRAESDSTIRKVCAMHLQKVNANLDGMGASSRSGESIQVVFSHAGTDTIYASKAFCVLQYTQNSKFVLGRSGRWIDPTASDACWHFKVRLFVGRVAV